MLEYDRIEVSHGIDVKKTEGSRECIICHYWYFLYINYRYQREVCKVCHDLMQKAMSFNNVVIFSVKTNVCKIHFRLMGKDKAINLLRNAD